MSPITTHILDVSQGRPAGGVTAHLDHHSASGWREIGSGVTNADGRIGDLLPDDYALIVGIYRLRFETADYFHNQGRRTFYPAVSIEFHIEATNEHYHVPLLLSPFGYSTYRGS